MINLETVKKIYIEVQDMKFGIEANGNLSKLYNLRKEFDETFDSFFDEQLMKKYNNWNEEEDCIGDLCNSEVEDMLDEHDTQKLVDFYQEQISWMMDDIKENVGKYQKDVKELIETLKPIRDSYVTELIKELNEAIEGMKEDEDNE